jgi:excinuclease ABC subunit A
LVLNDAPAPSNLAGTRSTAPPVFQPNQDRVGTRPYHSEAFSHQPPQLSLSHATRHNLKDLSVEIPLGRFVCITGVSGSGKTTLIREALLPTLAAKLKTQSSSAKASDRSSTENAGDDEENPPGGDNPSGPKLAQVQGWEQLDRVVLVDQSILGKTPRSNPAVYIGAFDDIREFFAQSEIAKQRGLNASAFSFNSARGQCERCRGAGFEKIEMQFLSDVFIRCPDCDGRRYRAHILEVKIRRQELEGSKPSNIQHPTPTLQSASIADLLDSTVDEVIEFLSTFSESKTALRAVGALKLLQEVGLGYLKLGQPINTLSGGESQRLKLVRHLAEAGLESDDEYGARRAGSQAGRLGHYGPSSSTLFLFDEPTTGLHFDDVRILLKVFQRLVDAGHSVLVIEHNLDVIKSADWLIDLGPDAGDQGGQIVAQGTPEDVAACHESHTGRALQDVLSSQNSMPL